MGAVAVGGGNGVRSEGGVEIRFQEKIMNVNIFFT